MQQDKDEIDFRVDKVGDGPMFEVVLNNVRLDVTRAGPLYSLRVSGFVNDRQLETIKEMFTHLFESRNEQDLGIEGRRVP